MKFTFTLGDASVMPNGMLGALIHIPKEYKANYDEFIKLLQTEDVKTLEVIKYKEKRSLSANSALWIMCDKIAKKINSTKDDIYVQMLLKYGVFETVIIKNAAYSALEHKINKASSAESKISLCKIINEYTKGNENWLEVQCYFGSSTYNADEFRFLLNGVIEDAKELNIDFFSKHEIEQMLEVL